MPNVPRLLVVVAMIALPVPAALAQAASAAGAVPQEAETEAPVDPRGIHHNYWGPRDGDPAAEQAPRHRLRETEADIIRREIEDEARDDAAAEDADTATPRHFHATGQHAYAPTFKPITARPTRFYRPDEFLPVTDPKADGPPAAPHGNPAEAGATLE